MSQSVDDATMRRVLDVIDDVVQRRQAGEPLSNDAVIAAHPDIAELLCAELGKLGFNSGATDVASPTPSFSGEQEHSPRTIDYVHTETKHGPSSRLKELAADRSGQAEATRFRAVRTFAVGGMGEVWLALDTQIKREVALKVLKESRRKDQSILERFLAEGHVTGSLEHPGIVPVYALGVDAAQKPYYAMRLVRGESLHRAIKTFHGTKGADTKAMSRGNLKFRELLRRIADVCVTIAYAHSRGVLHRDLKPDNVMLGKFGETYVVDWGMARVLESPAEISSISAEAISKPERWSAESGTRYGSAMGTPGFMSPEQAAGKLDELTLATDVYSLGAILYFLLTGEVSIKASSLDDFLRRVEVGEFPPPHTANPHAPKNLCAVCEKAMSHLPAARYASARDVATDIERWLADEPVGAATETWQEKTARFGRRHHRWLIPLLGAATLIAVSLSIAASSIDRARRRAEGAAIAEADAKGRAEKNFLEARDTVDEWLTGFTEALKYYPIAGDFRQQMLQQAASRYERFLEQASEDAVVQLEAGRTYLRLGDIRRELKTPDAATAAFNHAADIFQKLVAASPQPVAQQALAQSFGRLALAYDDVGNAKQARELHERALKAGAQRVGDQANEEVQRQQKDQEATLGDLEINYAVFLANHGDMQAAAKTFGEVVSRLKRLASEDPGRLETRISLATALMGWGQVIGYQGNSTKARELYQQAAAYFAGAAQLADESPRYITLTADANLHLASAERMLGNYEAEANAYRETIKAYDQLNARLPNSPKFLGAKALTQVDLGQISADRGQIAIALAALEAAEATYGKLRADFPTVVQYQEAHGLALDMISMAHASRGDSAEALKYAEAAFAEFLPLATLGSDTPAYQMRVAVCQSHLGQIWATDGKYEEAGKEFSAAMQRLASAATQYPDNPGPPYAAAVTASRWGETLALAGNDAEAAKQADVADRYWQQLKALSADPEYLAGAAWHYATFPVESKRVALRAADYAHSAVEKSPNNKYYAAVNALAQLQNGKARECAAKLAELKDDGSDPFAAAIADYVAAMAQMALGDAKAAQAAYESAVAKSEKDLSGRWEIATLRRQCEKLLKPPAAAPAPTTPAAAPAVAPAGQK